MVRPSIRDKSLAPLMCSSTKRRSGGFSLIEMMVSLLLLSIAMSIAARLMLESQLRLAHSAEQALDPESTLALKLLRADIRASAAVTARDSEWSWDPLSLVGHPNGALRYQKVGTDLIRRIGATDGRLASERIVLRDVTVWRWRIDPTARLQLVEIELGHRETPRLGSFSAGGERVANVPITRRHRVSVSPRRAGGKDLW